MPKGPVSSEEDGRNGRSFGSSLTPDEPLFPTRPFSSRTPPPAAGKFLPTIRQSELASALHELPRFSYAADVSTLLTEDYPDYVLGTLVVPALIVFLFLLWAIAPIVSKCTAVLCRHPHRSSSNRKKPKRNVHKCRSTALLGFLWSFVFLVVCSSLYVGHGALDTEDSLENIVEGLEAFETIASRAGIATASLVESQQKAALLGARLVESLGSTLSLMDDLAYLNANDMDKLVDVSKHVDEEGIRASHVDGMVGVDEIAEIRETIDAVPENNDAASSKPNGGIKGLEIIMPEMGRNSSSYDETDELDVLIPDIDARASSEDELGRFRKLSTRYGALSSKDYESAIDADGVDYLEIRRLINRSIEELTSLGNLSEAVLLNVSGAIDGVASSILAVKQKLSRVGGYVKTTAYFATPVLSLPFCLIVGLGIGYVHNDRPSRTTEAYSRFLSRFVVPLFILVITCCVVGFTVVGFVAVVTSDACVDTERLIVSVLERNGVTSGDFLFELTEHYILTACRSPGAIGIDRLVPKIEQAVVDSETVSLTLAPECGLVDCATINDLVDELVDVLDAVLVLSADVLEIIECDGIHGAYSAVVRDEACGSFLTGSVWMYLMLLFFSLFGTAMITLRNVVWIGPVVKIAPSATEGELADLSSPVPMAGGDGNDPTLLPRLGSTGGMDSDAAVASSGAALDFTDARRSLASKERRLPNDRPTKDANNKTGGRNMGERQHSGKTERRNNTTDTTDESRKSGAKNTDNTGDRDSKHRGRNESVRTKDWDYTTDTKERYGNGGERGDEWEFETDDSTVRTNKCGMVFETVPETSALYRG